MMRRDEAGFVLGEEEIKSRRRTDNGDSRGRRELRPEYDDTPR
jgi:hypothetical protein